MSHSHEPSYYEIALTNRQVLVVFVVLLVCIVVAFFSGVWVGRQNGPFGTATEAQATASDSEARTGSEPGVEKLHFFSEDREAAEATVSLAEIAQEPQGDTTLLEDLGGADPQQAAGGEPAAQVAAGSETASSATEKSTAGAPIESPVGGGHVIQVFSSSDEQQAERVHQQLVSGGFPAFLSPVDVDGQTMYRVRIGPYRELSEAETVADRVRRGFKLDTWVTR